MDNKLIKILGNSNFENFCENYSEIIENEFFNMLFFLIENNDDLENLFYDLFKLANFIFSESQGQYFGDPQHFNINKTMLNYQEFLYKFSFFYSLDIQFYKWENLAIASIEIIENCIKEKDFKYKEHLKYQNFKNEYDVLFNDILSDPIMKQRYFDYLNGAY